MIGGSRLAMGVSQMHGLRTDELGIPVGLKRGSCSSTKPLQPLCVIPPQTKDNDPLSKRARRRRARVCAGCEDRPTALDEHSTSKE